MAFIGKESSANPTQRGKKDCQSVAREMLEELRWWREQSQNLFSAIINAHSTQKQFSAIINAHSSSITRGINDLVEKVGELETELLVIRKERNGLLETVDDLNVKIRHLSEKLPKLEPLAKYFDDDIKVLDNSEIEVPNTIEQEVDREIIKKELDYKDECIHNGDISDQNVMELNTDSLNDWDDMDDAALDAAFNASTYVHWNNVEHRLQDMKISPGQKSPEDSNNEDRDDKLRCEQCPYCTSRIYMLKRHVKAVHDKIRDYVCEECDYAASQKSQIRRHMANIHKMGENFKCQQCPYTSAEQRKIRTHMANVHKMGEKLLCEKCDYATSEKSKLRIHMVNVHNIGEKKFKCEKCPYASAEKRKIRVHMVNVHKMGERKFKCQQCPYASARVEHLNEHIKAVHKKIKDHVCDVCGFASTKKNNLKVHMDSVHKMGSKQFKCEFCPYEAYVETVLKKHVKNVHLIKENKP